MNQRAKILQLDKKVTDLKRKLDQKNGIDLIPDLHARIRKLERRLIAYSAFYGGIIFTIAKIL